MVGARTSCDDAADAFDEGRVLHVLARDVERDVLRVDDSLHEAQPVREDVVSSDPISTVSWPWVPARGSLEPSRRDGEDAQKTGKDGEKTGEIWSKECGQGRDRRDHLHEAQPVREDVVSLALDHHLARVHGDAAVRTPHACHKDKANAREL